MKSLPARLLMFAFSFMITSCAHEPKQVEASLPLVNSIHSSYKIMPQALQGLLNDQMQGSTFSNDRRVYSIDQTYISALGRQCMKLHYNVNQEYSKRTVVCKENNLWYQVPQLEQASVSSLIMAK